MTHTLALVLLLAGDSVPKEEKVKAEEVTPALVELVARPAVQRELKLSAEQRLKLIDGLEEADTNVFLNRLKNGPGPFDCFPSPTKLTEVQKACRVVVAGMLSREQFVRLQQVEVQVLDVRALRLKRVADALPLTDEQRTAVYDGSLTERSKQLETVLDGLTPAQRKVWDGLRGEQLELKVLWSAFQAEEVEHQLLWIKWKPESPAESKSTRHPPTTNPGK